MKYICDVCGWEYDEEKGYPEGGIAPGTKWEDVPEDFECPLCMVGKDQFSEEQTRLVACGYKDFSGFMHGLESLFFK